MSSCPNCHQPVAPTDDICENCGAVLSTLMPTPAFVAASSPLASAISSAGQAQGAVPTILPDVCPNCGQRLHPGDDICEQCGMVISGGLAGSGTVGANSTIPQNADNLIIWEHHRQRVGRCMPSLWCATQAWRQVLWKLRRKLYGDNISYQHERRNIAIWFCCQYVATGEHTQQ